MDKIAKYGVTINFAIMLSIGILVLIFGEYGVKLFIQDGAAVDYGRRYIAVIALCYPFLGINFILNGIVRAAGAMYQVLVLNIISFWVLRFPLTSLFSSFFGEIGIAYGMGLSYMISSVIAFSYFRFGKYRKKNLFK